MKKLLPCLFVVLVVSACTSNNFRVPLSWVEDHDEKQANQQEAQFQRMQMFNEMQK
ncbi:hypothetical protein HBN50_08650 [Halobacteriovorax sp. GB3]|uniref:hypothetical protein n=1 Tax=Halobacteriovorax sp. GB3 TaxID=2719615 RepID=UPI002360F4BB|nr:hypothetical protein [Halobacteriovorax sp. GB3]MDD0853164.1 hypothetical protein [Halobacteriovorax sp. GB3]